MNDGRPTRCNTATGVESAIDLSLCDPTLSLIFNWGVLQDLYDSDHYIIIYGSSANEVPPPEKWNFNIANWDYFNNLILNKLSDNCISDILSS